MADQELRMALLQASSEMASAKSLVMVLKALCRKEKKEKKKKGKVQSFMVVLLKNEGSGRENKKGRRWETWRGMGEESKQEKVKRA